MVQPKVIKVKSVSISNENPFVLIAGPCQLESRDHALFMAEALVKITERLKIDFIFKSSFDKANRTSISSARGLGLDESLKIFSEIKNSFFCPILTDIHTESQCSLVSEVVDVLQIPAFLCRQTDLLCAAAQTGRVINVKKGQFLAPWDMKYVSDKIESCGSSQIILTERGSCFGYNNLVADMRSLPLMAKSGYPVVFDATHAVQYPGGCGAVSGGSRELSPYLAQAAIAVGVAGVFIETHDNPDQALSDGPNMIALSEIGRFLEKLKALDAIVKSKSFKNQTNLDKL